MHLGILLSVDPQLRRQVETHLGDAVELLHCASVAELAELAQGRPVRAVLVHLTPQVLGELTPGRFLSELTEQVRSAPLYMLVDAGCPPRLAQRAVDAADGVLSLPLSAEALHQAMAADTNLEGELEAFCRNTPHKELKGRTRSMVTFTPAMFAMMDDLRIAARHDVTVLLIGETGSGKTYLARLIHELSSRHRERFVTISCGALPPDLIESELFGYVKGAFTGADRDKEGKFKAVGRGTLLLDEIDVLPPEQQAKLLRVIETGEYEPVGSNETQVSQARLIVASNVDLDHLARSGAFRSDLYYRLNILRFQLLPLCQRPWDIEYFVRSFALEHSRAHGIALREIEPAVFEVLRRYSWPGNLREMENVLRRAVLYCRRGVLSVSDLPGDLRAAAAQAESSAPAADFFHGDPPANPYCLPADCGYGERSNAAAAATTTPLAPPLPAPPAPPRRGVLVNGGAARTLLPGRPSPHRGTAAAGSALPGSASSLPAAAPLTLESRLELHERRIIEDSLARNQHRRKETAAELGISRVTLYNKMKRFGLIA